MFRLKKINNFPKPLSKTDQKGKYSYFPGITTIAHCYPTHSTLCEAIYKALSGSKLVMEYYSLLPAQSYHMTTMDLHTADTEQRKGSVWTDFVDLNLSKFANINQHLKTYPIQPQIENISISIGWVISLTIILPKEQEVAIKSTAQAIGYEQSIPHGFHITLAYPRPQKNSTKEIFEKLKEEITEKLSGVLDQIQLPIKLEEHKLYYFNDMTAFHPWSAETNPFIQPPRELFNYNFFARKKKAVDARSTFNCAFY